MEALAAHDLTSLEQNLNAAGFPVSHARKILRYFYDHAGTRLPDYPNLGRRLIDRIATDFVHRSSHVAQSHTSADGTTKLRIGLADDKSVEAVLMPGPRDDRAAGCVSSQVGCAMGCDFCASTRNGLSRNLQTHEIVEQFLHLKELAARSSRRLQTLVFMGMGEPLNNLDNVIPAIRRIAHPDMGSLGWRHITVSTVGIVPGIEKLIDADLNIHLAVSLHAPDDETRSRLIPVNRRWPVREIVDASRKFYERTDRIPTIEYTLLADINDSDAQAHLLANVLDGLRAHVNLIPYNAIGAGVSGTVYARPSTDRMMSFLTILRSHGVVAHFRKTRGDDVAAACGQLAGV